MRPPVRPPRLRCALFPLIHLPHLLVLPATFFGLYLLLQTYPYFRALYVVPVRRTKSLLTASFRFHLTMDTLAVRLYTSSLPRRVRDFHPLERAHGAQTRKTVNQLIDRLIYYQKRFYSLCILKSEFLHFSLTLDLLDVSSKITKLLIKVFVSTFDILDIFYYRDTVRSKCCNNKRCTCS